MAKPTQTDIDKANDLISSSQDLLAGIKSTATKTPARKGKKAPQRKTTRETKATTRSKTTTAAAPFTANDTPVHAELVHAPVSGSGINGMVRGDIAQTDPQAMAQSLVAIQQQQNTVLISQANKKLDRAVAIDQGLGIETQLQQEKNATKAEAISTQAMKTNQQQAKTSIEGVRLNGLQIDLQGESNLLPHRQEGWAIKGEEMQIDNEGARSLLPLRREHWGAKLKLAQVGLQKLNMQIQQEMSEMYAPTPQSITQQDDY
jgi:hypothetical protein